MPDDPAEPSDPFTAPTTEPAPAPVEPGDASVDEAEPREGDRVNAGGDATFEEGSGEGGEPLDLEATINLSGDSPFFHQLADRAPAPAPPSTVVRSHLKGLLEALIFASDSPQKAADLAKAAAANLKEVRDLLVELKADYQPRGVQLDEVAGGFIFRTSPAYAPFVRDLTKQKPVRLSRAQVETLAILAYRQPVTRPEIDEIRGVDSGPVLKVLLERDLVRILGKKDEPGRPMIYGTTTAFLEFFGLKSLKDLPTLREFTELTEDSRRVAERELGEVLDVAQAAPEAVAGSDHDGALPEAEPESAAEAAATGEAEAAESPIGDESGDGEARDAGADDESEDGEPRPDGDEEPPPASH